MKQLFSERPTKHHFLHNKNKAQYYSIATIDFKKNRNEENELHN